jgi:hypothetical protein
MKVTRIIAAAAMSAVLAGTAQAQGPNTANCTGGTPSASPCQVQNTVSATIPWVARMSIASATTLPSPLAEDFGNSAGKSTTTPTTLTVSANAGIAISATAATAAWSGPYAKPAADLRIFLPSAPTTYLALNNVTSQPVFSSTTATASTNVDIGYNVLYSWGSDVPGSYSLTVNYTLTSP